MGATPVIWQQCLAHFLASVSARSGSRYTAVHYRALLTRFFGDFSRDPAMYSRADVEQFIGAANHGRVHHGQLPSAATRKWRLAVLGSFYQFCAGYTYTDSDNQVKPILTTIPPTYGMRSPKPSLRPRAISQAELEKLLSVIPNDLRGTRDKVIFLTLYMSLRRRSELFNLVRGDFTQVVFPSGRTGWVYRFSKKGASTVDDRAEMPDEAMHLILSYVAMSGRNWDTMPANEPVFLAIPPPNMKETTYTPPIAARGDTIAKRLKAYLQKAGLDPRLSLHSFRHGGSHARYSAGQDIRSIQRVLRHENISMTDLYLRILTGEEDETPPTLKERFHHLGEV